MYGSWENKEDVIMVHVHVPGVADISMDGGEEVFGLFYGQGDRDEE